MPGPDPKGVLLDVGGVLLPTPWERLEWFEAANGWPPRTLPWRGPLDPATDPLWQSVQAGELSSGAYFDRRAAEISALLGEQRSWPEVTRAMFDTRAGLAVRPEGPALIADARAAGLRTGLLTSKLVAFLSREVVARSELLSSFDVLLDESETGMAKPDPRAYEQAAAAMGLDPAGIVFVDDDPANVAGAVAAGMAGVQFDVTDPAGSFTRVRHQLRLRRPP
ncbi:MAG TPA: HAD-IA family hydrolase [Actinomycetes bacterium]|nr:HAD-IA family hydrolase [Actinomycetes bacterium]